nr:MAG TPA: hypothetical protein [Bacteriophage sp.]
MKHKGRRWGRRCYLLTKGAGGIAQTIGPQRR